MRDVEYLAKKYAPKWFDPDEDMLGMAGLSPF